MKVTMTVNVEPHGFRRPQVNFQARNVYTHPVQRRATDELQQALAASWAELGFQALPAILPVEVSTESVFARPLAHFEADRATLRAAAPLCHLSAPDVDNLLKLQLDAMSGAVFHDDAQVWSARAEKRWCEGPHAEQQASVTVVIRWEDAPNYEDLQGAAAAAAPANVECVDLTTESSDENSDASDDVGGDAAGDAEVDGESEQDDGVNENKDPGEDDECDVVDLTMDEDE